jgi:hypothetical protein
MKHVNKRSLFGVGALVLAGLLLAAPETVLAGAGGAEFQGAYDMLTGWMTGVFVAPDIIDNIVTATLPIV